MEWVILILLILFGIGLYGHKLSLENLISRVNDLEEKVGLGDGNGANDTDRDEFYDTFKAGID